LVTHFNPKILNKQSHTHISDYVGK
jgi:hypothetical protein